MRFLHIFRLRFFPTDGILFPSGRCAQTVSGDEFLKTFRILVINPGSTSTKFSLFENEKCLFTEDIFHDSGELLRFPTINDQLDFRLCVVRNYLGTHVPTLKQVDAIVGRGGGCYAIPGGIYKIDDALIDDTRHYRGGLYHASMLGVQMAARLQKDFGGMLLMQDPPVVDELCDLARVTGVKGVYRKTACHALNLKETARRHAQSLGKKYEECNLIVCHIDGGISITAHQKGRMIDGNDAGGGEGPFSPTRMGSMAVTDIIGAMKDVSQSQLKALCSQAGGFSSHFGTSSSNAVHRMVEEKDPRAVRVWNAMLYQLCKYIGSMAAVLEGKVDGIVLTGGLLRFPDVEESVRKHCGWIAPIQSYPGEFEQEALASGALRVLTGQEEALTYPGRPVWNGFPDEQ